VTDLEKFECHTFVVLERACPLLRRTLSSYLLATYIQKLSIATLRAIGPNHTYGDAIHGHAQQLVEASDFTVGVAPILDPQAAIASLLEKIRSLRTRMGASVYTDM